MSVENTQGQTPEMMSQGQNGQGNPAPEIVNTPPVDKAKEAEALTIQTAQELAAKAKEAPVEAAFEIVGHQAADAALKMMQGAGLKKADMDFIFSKAKQTGNLADINIAALEAKLGKENAALAMSGIRAYHDDSKRVNEGILKIAHEEAGGKEAWDAIAAWARTKAGVDKAFAAELAEYRELMQAGGKRAKIAAAEIKKLFTADPNTKGLQNGKMFQGDNSAIAGGGISRAEYVTELKKAHDKGDGAMVAQLQQRRAIGRAAGLR